MEDQNKLRWLNRAVFVVGAALALMYGGTKGFSPERITFLRTDPEIVYLIDDGSEVSTNSVSVSFASFALPQSANVILSYIPKPSTNMADEVVYKEGELSQWEMLMEVGEGKWTFDFENANSNRWFCYTTYTPGASVHTNGVAVMEMLFHPTSTNKFIPKNAVIIEDGKRVYDAGSESYFTTTLTTEE